MEQPEAYEGLAPRIRGTLGFTRGPQQAGSSQEQDPEKSTWGDVADPWGGQAPQQPPAPPPDDRTDQLIWQVALLQDENLQLHNDIADLRQRANQRGRPGAPPYRPDPDHYSIPRPPGWTPPGDRPVGDWDADNPLAFLQARPIIMKLPEPFKGEHDDMDCFHRRLQRLFRNLPPPIPRCTITYDSVRHLPLHQTCQRLVDPSSRRLLGQQPSRSRWPPIPIPSLGRIHSGIQGHIPGSHLRGAARKDNEDNEDG